MGPPQVISNLRILATSDVHMRITGWNALRDDVTADCGLDILARRIDANRRDAPGACLLLDNGDGLQGTPVGTTCATWPDKAAHPWPAVLNALDYDAVGLGNHDFDFGLALLERSVAQTKAPTLCASFASGRVKGVVPTTILNRALSCSDGIVRNIRIGITSVLPPQTALWNHRHLSGVIRVAAGQKSARDAVAALKAEGADLVIVLCHSGLPEHGGDDSENFAATLANGISDIDALVMGHTHQLFPDPEGPRELNGVPAVMPGFGAEALGVIDLRLEWTEQRWRVSMHEAALHVPQNTDTPRRDITALAAPAIADTRTSLNTALATTETGFDSYFDMLQPGMCCTILARTLTRRIAAQVAGSALADLPLIAAVSPAALGGRTGAHNFVEIPPGTVCARHIAILAPYADTIWAVTMQGADIWRWAERAATYFSPGKGANSRLANANVPSYNFDVLHGLEAVIDPFQTAMFDPFGRVIDTCAKRVQKLTYKGQPVAPTQRFLVAMTSYRGAGGGAFPGLPEDPDVLRTDIDLLTALCEDVSGCQLPAAPATSDWRFADAGGKRVLIETSPNARARLQTISKFDPHIIGINAAGFLEISVTL